MALFAIYRVKDGDNQLTVFFSDIRQEASVEHICVLPDCQWLIREISDQLESMGFELEHDRKLDDAAGELSIMATYVIPSGAGSSAEAIRAVCTRHDITASITTGEGKGLQQLA